MPRSNDLSIGDSDAAGRTRIKQNLAAGKRVCEPDQERFDLRLLKVVKDA
jgi:hypothetical protein